MKLSPEIKFKMKHIPLTAAIFFSLSAPVWAAEEVKSDKAATEDKKEEEKAPDLNETTLTGDWGGRRNEWMKNGVSFEGGWKYDALSSSGGTQDGNKKMSHIALGLRFDFEKLAGWEGGSGFVQLIDNGGDGLNANRVGSQVGVSNIEIGTPTTTRIFQAWVQKSFADDQFLLLAGVYPIDTEFFGMDSAGVFLGPQYGTPAELAQSRNSAVSVFNNSAFGLRLRWNAPSKTTYGMYAMLDGIPNDPTRPKDTAVLFNKGDGVFHIGEFGWLPQGANGDYKGHAKYALGLWGWSAKVNDQVDTDAAGNALRRSITGGYVLAEQTLLRLDGDGSRFLSGFARYTWNDGDSTQLKGTWNLGLHFRGLIPSRPDDILGLAYTRAEESKKYIRSQHNSNTMMANAEHVWELTYRAQINPWLAIQPNFQTIRHPGGTMAARNASIVGARFELVF